MHIYPLTGAVNLGPLLAGQRAARAGDIAPAPAGTTAQEEPIWHGMVAEFGYPPAGVAWTPAHEALVEALLGESAGYVVVTEPDDDPTSVLTLRARAAS